MILTSVLTLFRELELPSVLGPPERQGLYIPEPERPSVLIHTHTHTHTPAVRFSVRGEVERQQTRWYHRRTCEKGRTPVQPLCNTRLGLLRMTVTLLHSSSHPQALVSDCLAQSHVWAKQSHVWAKQSQVWAKQSHVWAKQSQES